MRDYLCNWWENTTDEEDTNSDNPDDDIINTHIRFSYFMNNVPVSENTTNNQDKL